MEDRSRLMGGVPTNDSSKGVQLSIQPSGPTGPHCFEDRLASTERRLFTNSVKKLDRRPEQQGLCLPVPTLNAEAPPSSRRWEEAVRPRRNTRAGTEA